MWGDDADGVSGKDVYITPGTNKKMLPSIVFTVEKKKCSGNGVKCGYGGSCGKLNMRCVDDSTICTLYS
ncbi:MAG: hypothetical protein IJA32_07035 [Lachnospiraceae bacterium]|nr:hypothetical protein [Lachnospiraceae bacterium]